MTDDEGCYFDEIIDRHGSNSLKWDTSGYGMGKNDILPMWVADMDFAAPQPVIQAMQEVAAHGIYGYSDFPGEFYESIIHWCSVRHGFQIERDWISWLPGVIPGLCMSIQAFTKPGDEVIIQTPVYPPFFDSIRNNGRTVVENPLAETDNGYVMDIDHLNSCIGPRTRMIVLCSPHNPVGRVWTREELETVAEIACRHNLIVFSDEIHGDIVYDQHRHLPFASLSKEVSDRSITGFAPSKTFNIAGLKASVIVTANRRMKQEIDHIRAAAFGISSTSNFAIRALQAAYQQGGPWLNALLPYLESNARYACNHIARKIPQIKTNQPEGTFLLWLDFRNLGMDQENLRQLVTGRARVELNDGVDFGNTGNGFMRLNFGCPRSFLEDGLNRLTEAINGC